MQRRAYLSALGTAALTSLAGCSAGTPQPPAGDQPTDDETGSSPSTTTGDEQAVRVDTVVSGLEVPWGAAYHDGDLYLTERPGRIVRVRDGQAKPLVEEVPDLRPRGEGGLLGLVFHPSDPVAYTYQTYDNGSGPRNRVVRHAVDDGWTQETVFDGIPAASIHNGGRLGVHDDALFVTTGDASDRGAAQDTDSLAGKVLRLTLDGEPHPDNPLGNAVFTYGHRNPQGLAFRDGTLFSTEHGPDTDDEINVLVAGENYGWPEVRGRGGGDEFTDPIATYTPTIAPGSATFYEGPIRAWQGDFFFGTLSGRHLHRVRIEGRRVVEQERLYEGRFGRLRTVLTDPDGHLLVTTSNRDGRGRAREGDDKVLRFRPADE